MVLGSREIKAVNLSILSMLLGAAALFLGIYLFYAPAAGWSEVSAQGWRDGPAVSRGETYPLDMELNGEGRALLALPVSRFSSVDYPYLHLRFSQVPEYDSLQILWSASPSGERAMAFDVTGPADRDLWLDTRKMPGWVGEIALVGVLVKGKPGSRVPLETFKLLPANPTSQLRATLEDWTAFSSWQGHAINLYPGVQARNALLFPAPALAVFLALSLLCYGVLLLVFRRALQFDWRVIATVFLVGWFVLDVLWQGRLWQQVQATYSLFGGKTTGEQLAVGPDAELVRFLGEVEAALEGETSRIFVASADEYKGMRAAYYLLPRNTFWRRKKSWLPRSKQMDKGDYVLLMQPTRTRFDPAKGVLVTKRKKRIKVEPVLSTETGSLFRVR